MEVYDLCLLYVEDGLSWSSYLCGQFESSCKVFWEDVSKLPLNDKASSIIKSARAQLLIISPQYIELYDEYIHNLLINPIGFLCGVEVDSVDYTEFVKRNPVFTEWMLVSATDDIEKIASVVFQAIEMATPPDDMYVRVDRPARKSTKKSKYPRDIAKKLNKDKMVIQPSKALCGEAATLVVILKAALLTDTTTKYTVKFKSATKEIDMEATRLNEFTLTVQVPQDFPPGSAIATVTKPGVLSSLGECRFKFEDKLKHISDYILDTLNPIDFLCQAMEISPSDVVVLDNILTSNYKKSMPWEGLDKMGSIVHEMQAVAKTRETPTLIHFAAKFGLRELCALLINSPGAILAYEIENCNGDYPHDLASQSGYEDLAVFLSSFVEYGALCEETWRVAYEQKKRDGHDQDDLYMCMDQAPVNPYCDMGNDTPMASLQGLNYVQMTPTGRMNSSHTDNFLALQRQLEIQGLYDVPFGVAIPADPLFDCKRNELEKLINGEETDIENIYDTLPGLSDDIYDSVEDEDRATPAPFDLASRYSFRRPVMSTGPGKTIEDPSEIYSAAQKELINIQKQVKDKMISIDDAVRIFEAFKLHEKDQFYSYKTQTEFIYAARDSLSKNKEKLQSQQQQQPSRAPAAPPDIPPRGVSEEQERWNKLYRKMTVKVDKGARKKKAIRRGSEEFSRGIQRHGRDGSNSSTASSRSSRSSIRSIDSCDIAEEEPTCIKKVNRMRHDNFSDEYKTKPIPPLPPTIDVSRARDVHQSRLEELDEAYVDRLPPRPPIEKPRPPPQIPRHFKNPQVEDEYDLQRPVMQALSPQEQMIKELRNRTPRPTTTQNTEPYDDVEATQPSSKPTPTPRQRQMPRK